MMKRLTISLVLLALIMASVPALAVTSEEVTNDNLSGVIDMLASAGLNNTDVFEKWAGDYLQNGQAGEYSDADCRMTVMLLASGKLTSGSVNEAYTGTYLMFDIDAIENDPAFALLKEHEALFTTMFGEMEIPPSGFERALEKVWEEHGIAFGSDSCSIISLVFRSYGEETAFVGHTGILIDRGEGASGGRYAFIEKLAFWDPFVISYADSEEEIIDMLSARPDYTADEGEPAPAVYRNGEYIGSLD